MCRVFTKKTQIKYKARGVFRAQLNIYDGAFGTSDVWLGSKYVSEIYFPCSKKWII